MARDYQSSLTGPQMDQALLDMANHTSERYAKGTAEGQAVAPGTPGYQDNAKYYKDQAAAQVDLAAGQVRLAELQVAAAASQVDLAENAAQRAESAVPAGTDSAVLFTRDQSGDLTDAQKATARKNIMAGGTNPNLLDNPWFTINQRGQNSYVGKVYSYDRWKVYSGVTLTADANGVVLSTGSGTNFNFFQPLENSLAQALRGKQVTFSILFTGGNVWSGTGTFPAELGTDASLVAGLGNGLNLYAAGSLSAAGITGPCIQLYRGYSYGPVNFAVRAMKLEVGNVSTITNDAPPDYDTELAKCQHYFMRLEADQAYAPFGVGYIATASTAHIFVPINMRRRPISAVARGTFRLMGSTNHSGITISSSDNSSSRLARLNISGGTGWAVGQACALGADNDAGAYIDFSADL